MKRCVNCGTELKETNYGRYFCYNCGFLIDNQEKEDEEDSKTKNLSYIG